MKILLLGIPKTGTTFIYYLLKQSLPDKYFCLFEPSSNEMDYSVYYAKKNILIKDLFVIESSIHNFSKIISEFEKTIFIIRDPRDRLISAFFYFFVNKRNRTSLNIKTELVFDKVRQKINDPSIHFLSILKELGFSPEQIDHNYKLYQKYLELVLDSDSLLIKYESIVEGETGILGDYLGVKINNRQVIAHEHIHVTRSRFYGDWRNWFTPDDVHFFKNKYQDLLLKLGYEDDWVLNDNPKIDPKSSIDYLEKYADYF